MKRRGRRTRRGDGERERCTRERGGRVEERKGNGMDEG